LLLPLFSFVLIYIHEMVNCNFDDFQSLD
jgi:hypothetical protein